VWNRWLQAGPTATIEQVVADAYAQASTRGIRIPILIDLMHVLGYL
jgi:hypothetical protein